jgi:hypothetical protein
VGERRQGACGSMEVVVEYLRRQQVHTHAHTHILLAPLSLLERLSVFNLMRRTLQTHTRTHIPREREREKEGEREREREKERERDCC